MIGETLALLSAVAFAMGSVAIAKGSAHSSGESGVFLSVLMTGALSISAWLFVGMPLVPFHQEGTLWAAVAWFAASGVLATVWGRLTLFKAIEYAGVVRASTVRRLTPFFSVLLAWAILAETISAVAGSGMIVIAASFALLIADRRAQLADDTGIRHANIPRGYTMGTLSAGSYAASYVVRKNGLTLLPDPYIGAFIGSLTAFFYYVVSGFVSPAYKGLVRRALTRPDSWQLLAAFCISLGQIMQFAALTHTGVARVAIINSVEIFIASYLAVFIFRTEKMPSVLVLAATVLATIGVVLVALG